MGRIYKNKAVFEQLALRDSKVYTALKTFRNYTMTMLSNSGKTRI